MVLGIIIHVCTTGSVTRVLSKSIELRVALVGLQARL